MALVSKQGQPVYAGPTPAQAPNANPNAVATNTSLYYDDPSTGTNISKSMPFGGVGRDYATAREGQAEGVLRGATTQDEGDFANRDALRQAMSKQIAQYGGLDDQRSATFGANQQRALSNNIAQARRQMGGTGLGGSLQAGRGLGDILAASQRANNEGRNQMQLQKGQELGQLAGVNQANLQQSLAERGFTLQQAKSLSDLLQQQSAQELGSVIQTRSQPGPSDFEKYLGYGLQVAGTGAQVVGGLAGTAGKAAA